MMILRIGPVLLAQASAIARRHAALANAMLRRLTRGLNTDRPRRRPFAAPGCSTVKSGRDICSSGATRVDGWAAAAGMFFFFAAAEPESSSGFEGCGGGEVDGVRVGDFFFFFFLPFQGLCEI